MKINVLSSILRLISQRKSETTVQYILQQSLLRSQSLFLDLPCYNQVEELVRRIIGNKECSTISLLHQEILNFNLYVLTLLPLLRLIEVVRQSFLEKYIKNIPSFVPFTRQQVQDEAISVFNDFIESLCLKGSKNLFNYIRGKPLQSQKTWLHYFQIQLQFVQKANSNDIVQPNDFKRQSSVVLKHLNYVSLAKNGLQNQMNQKEQNCNDLIFIFLGDIHNHKLIKDPDHLLNLIDHMTPYLWGSKYVPLMHKISECLDEDELETSKYFETEEKVSKLELELKKHQFADLLKNICKEYTEILKSTNFQTLYHYLLSLSFMKFYNRLGPEGKINDIYRITILHQYERNYRVHFKNYLEGKSNYMREFMNNCLIDKAIQEFISIILYQ